MLDPSARAEFDQQYRVIQAIYFALWASIFIYLAVGYIIGKTLSLPAGGEPSEILTKIFYGLVGGIILMIFLIRKWLIPPSAIFLSSQAEISKVISKYRTGYILVFALSEAIAFLGLALLFLSGSFTHLASFALVSLALMAILYPRRVESLEL